jgi:hypothetical protein
MKGDIFDIEALAREVYPKKPLVPMASKFGTGRRSWIPREQSQTLSAASSKCSVPGEWDYILMSAGGRSLAFWMSQQPKLPQTRLRLPSIPAYGQAGEVNLKLGRPLVPILA